MNFFFIGEVELAMGGSASGSIRFHVVSEYWASQIGDWVSVFEQNGDSSTAGVGRLEAASG